MVAFLSNKIYKKRQRKLEHPDYFPYAESKPEITVNILK